MEANALFWQQGQSSSCQKRKLQVQYFQCKVTNSNIILLLNLLNLIKHQIEQITVFKLRKGVQDDRVRSEQISSKMNLLKRSMMSQRKWKIAQEIISQI